MTLHFTFQNNTYFKNILVIGWVSYIRGWVDLAHNNATFPCRHLGIKAILPILYYCNHRQSFLHFKGNKVLFTGQNDKWTEDFITLYFLKELIYNVIMVTVNTVWITKVYEIYCQFVFTRLRISCLFVFYFTGAVPLVPGYGGGYPQQYYQGTISSEYLNFSLLIIFFHLSPWVCETDKFVNPLQFSRFLENYVKNIIQTPTGAQFNI